MLPASDSRVLVIPAAGVGSRLKARTPKFLVPVDGRAMVDRLIDLYRPWISQVVLVVSRPSVEAARQREETAGVPVTVAVQEHPTGMLDAVLLAREAVAASPASHVWITWCDQIAIHPQTVRRLGELSAARPDAAVVMPVSFRRQPYIHFERDVAGRIVAVRHRREGDIMPEVGENDAGLFSLSRAAFLGELTDYATSVELGAGTGERNLLPFIPWVAARHDVIAFPCVDEMEAVGINTPEELMAVETYLRARAAGGPR